MKPKLVVLRVAFGWLKKSDAVTRCMRVCNFANEVHLDGIYGQLCRHSDTIDTRRIYDGHLLITLIKQS